MRILDLIPDGKKNAISRKMLVQKADLNGLIPTKVRDKDRYVRKLIAEAREDDVIISDPKGGYYVPTADDVSELAEYVDTERGRATSIFISIRHADRVLADLLHRRISEVRRSDGLKEV